MDERSGPIHTQKMRFTHHLLGQMRLSAPAHHFAIWCFHNIAFNQGTLWKEMESQLTELEPTLVSWYMVSIGFKTLSSHFVVPWSFFAKQARPRTQTLACWEMSGGQSPDITRMRSHLTFVSDLTRALWTWTFHEPHLIFLRCQRVLLGYFSPTIRRILLPKLESWGSILDTIRFGSNDSDPRLLN